MFIVSFVKKKKKKTLYKTRKPCINWFFLFPNQWLRNGQRHGKRKLPDRRSSCIVIVRQIARQKKTKQANEPDKVHVSDQVLARPCLMSLSYRTCVRSTFNAVHPFSVIAADEGWERNTLYFDHWSRTQAATSDCWDNRIRRAETTRLTVAALWPIRIRSVCDAIDNRLRS